MWTGRRILPIYSLWRVVLRSTQGTSDLHGLTELTWPARQQPHSNFLSFFQDVHTQPYSHTQKLSGPFEEGKTAPPGANSDPVTWNCDCHNLPRFRGLLLFSNISETCHVPRDLYYFVYFSESPKPATFLAAFSKLRKVCQKNYCRFCGFFLWTCCVSIYMNETCL